MRRFLGVLCVAPLVGGCPKKAPDAAGSPAADDRYTIAFQAGCPSPTLEVTAAQCAEQAAGRGLSPEAPLEWGPGAAPRVQLSASELRSRRAPRTDCG